ncbi:potassium transport protein Kup [Serratia proteamaculans]|nr:potassium transport protein Kup [Serratia proteamaculans]CAI0948820.1 potassium transport protein Kup [Serratia proteamaculans]CAI2061712.1 potassium transport protein Kup [Serratia proteamaculans]
MPTGNEPEKTPQMSLPLLAGGALGVVFGDIGTSPLYTLKTVLFLSGDAPSPSVILGLLSLIFWTLVILAERPGGGNQPPGASVSRLAIG